VASNFERYLYYRLGKDSAQLCDLMNGFARNKTMTVKGSDGLFAAGEAGTSQTLETIKKVYKNEGYILDPHTAVGVAVAEKFQCLEVPTICLATAHPAKFNEAIQRAMGVAAHHPVLDALEGAPTRCRPIANDERAIRDYLVSKIERK
jgi:threonine synthase